MTLKNATEDKQDINQALLIKTATTVEMLNTRLFGGDGQIGALPYLLEQHKTMNDKLDKNKQDMMDRIDAKKDEIVKTIDTKKKETEEDIERLEDKHDALNNRVNWFAGGLGAIGSAATLAMGWFGLHHKG